MAESNTVFLVSSAGETVAELRVGDAEEGWYLGTVVWADFPSEVQKALAWYDEVLREQMLSYLDEAADAVQGFALRARFPDGSTRETNSLHVSPSNEVTFRTSSVALKESSEAAAVREGLAKIYSILGERFDSGQADTAARHDEHQP